MKSIRYLTTIVALVFFAAGTVGAQSFSDPAAARNYIHPKGPVSPNQTRANAASAPEADGVFHNGETLICSYCHVIHSSQQHSGANPEGDAPWGAYPQTFTPSKQLLKASDPVLLCVSCHDNVVGIPDVVGTDINGLSDRPSGFFSLPNAANARGHKLETGLPSVANGDWDLCMRCHFGGDFTTAAVSCIDCHNPHGNAKARNLQWASYPGGEPDFGIYGNGATGIAKYDASNVAYGDPGNGIVYEATNMCTDCHHVFSGASYTDPDGNGIHSKHPTYDSERGQTNNIAQGASKGTTDPAHWDDGTGAGFRITPRVRFVNRGASDFASASTIDASVNGVFCLSCHKAHGSDRAFGLTWDPVSGVGGEGCDQCHAKTVGI